MICIADVGGVRCDKEALFGSNYCGLHNRFVLTDTPRFGGLGSVGGAFRLERDDSACEAYPDRLDPNPKDDDPE